MITKKHFLIGLFGLFFILSCNNNENYEEVVPQSGTETEALEKDLQVLHTSFQKSYTNLESSRLLTVKGIDNIRAQMLSDLEVNYGSNFKVEYNHLQQHNAIKHLGSIGEGFEIPENYSSARVNFESDLNDYLIEVSKTFDFVDVGQHFKSYVEEINTELSFTMLAIINRANESAEMVDDIEVVSIEEFNENIYLDSLNNKLDNIALRISQDEELSDTELSQINQYLFVMKSHLPVILDFSKTLVGQENISNGRGSGFFRRLASVFKSVVTAVVTTIVTTVTTVAGVFIGSAGGVGGAILGGTSGFWMGINLSFNISCKYFPRNYQHCLECRQRFPSIRC